MPPTPRDDFPTAPRSWQEARSFWARDRARNNETLSLVTLWLFRVGQWLERDRRRHLAPARKAWRVAYNTWCGAIVGIELPALLHIGAGVRLRHAGRGVVLHPRVVIGEDAIIFHRVTVGIRGAGTGEVPVIGDRVSLLTDCTVIGGVVVGDDATVGAHAVVIENIPPGGVVVPAKARILPAR